MSAKTQALRIYCSTEEASEIAASAGRAGLSVSKFGRLVCIGMAVPSREDAQARRELLKVNADLARLGGLLKIALRYEQAGEVRRLVGDLARTQETLKGIVRELHNTREK